MPKFLNERYMRSLYTNYSRTNPGIERTFERRAKWLASLSDMDDTFLVVGAGFGGLIRHLNANGRQRVWGLEPGDYYWDSDPSEWEGVTTVAKDWIGSPTTQASLAKLGAGLGYFNFVIDEDAITLHEDHEFDDFIAGLEKHRKGNDNSKIIHIVSILGNRYGDSAVNWKTLDEWKSVAPTHTWVDSKTI